MGLQILHRYPNKSSRSSEQINKSNLNLFGLILQQELKPEKLKHISSDDSYFISIIGPHILLKVADNKIPKHQDKFYDKNRIEISALERSLLMNMSDGYLNYNMTLDRDRYRGFWGDLSNFREILFNTELERIYYVFGQNGNPIPIMAEKTRLISVEEMTQTVNGTEIAYSMPFNKDIAKAFLVGSKKDYGKYD